MAPNPKTVIRRLFRRGKRSAPIPLRPLSPHDPSKPSLATLNGDVLGLVVESLHDVDPRSLNALALVCSALYHKARYVQLRDFSVDMNKDSRAGTLAFLSQSDLLPGVRTLRVQLSRFLHEHINKPNLFPGDDDRRGRLKLLMSHWDQLGRLIPLMSGLRHLHWTGLALPEPVLDHLRNKPQIQLHLDIKIDPHVISDENRPHSLLKQLAGDLPSIPGFSELRFTLIHSGAAMCCPLMADFLKPVLVSCRQIRTLALDMSFPRSGCVSLGPDVDYHGLGLANGEALPPLEDLEILSYPWGQQPTRGFNWRGYPEPVGNELHYWAQHMDWSRLRRLHLDDTHYDSFSIHLAALIGSQLTALEEVSLSSPFNHIDNSIPGFFAALPGTLTSITLPDLARSLISPATLIVHAATLRTLALTDAPIPNADLAALRDGLPSLTSLTLVAAREAGAWPHDTLAIVAGFRSLEELTLWFDVGPSKEPLTPYLTVSATAEMFAYLRGRGARRLRRLWAHSGLKERPITGLRWRFDNDWEDYNRMGFVCEMVGDGGRDGPLGATRCLALDGRRNERLRKVAAGGLMEEGEKRDARFVIALKGPMPEKEWMAWTEATWTSPRRDDHEGLREWGLFFLGVAVCCCYSLAAWRKRYVADREIRAEARARGE